MLHVFRSQYLYLDRYVHVYISIDVNMNINEI